jgi:hypothetical protein
MVCNPEAMSRLQRERRQVLVERLRRRILAILEQPSGFEFRLPPEAWPLAADLIPLERLCCPFLR